MNRIALALAAVLTLPVIAARAETPDPSGQFAASAPSTVSRAQVAADLAQFQASGINPWSISYNPLAQFHGEKSRAQVEAEFMADRDHVAAMNGEDSGSALLAKERQATPGDNQFAATGAAKLVR